MENNEQENNELQELRNIIMGLRMPNYSEIDDEAILDKVKFMIGELPSSEKLDSMAGNSAELKYLRDKIGYIMSVIKGGGCKDEAFKARYEAKKDMPPRYKVLKWRGAMNKTLTSGLIKMSSFADAHSNPLIAEKAIVLAKKSSAGDVSEEELRIFMADCKNAGFEREAQNWMKNKWDEFQAGRQTKKQDKGIMQQLQQTKEQNAKTATQLNLILRLMQSDDYDTGRLQQVINQIPSDEVKGRLSDFSNYIGQLEGTFHTKMQELTGVANGMIAAYQKSGGQNFGDGTAVAPAESAVTNEEGVAGGAIADDTASAPVASEPAAAAAAPAAAVANPLEKMNTTDIYNLIKQNSDENTFNELNNDGWNGKALGQLTQPEWVGLAKSLGIDKVAKTKKSIKLSSNRKWIRVA